MSLPSLSAADCVVAADVACVGEEVDRPVAVSSVVPPVSLESPAASSPQAVSTQRAKSGGPQRIAYSIKPALCDELSVPWVGDGRARSRACPNAGVGRMPSQSERSRKSGSVGRRAEAYSAPVQFRLHNGQRVGSNDSPLWLCSGFGASAIGSALILRLSCLSCSTCRLGFAPNVPVRADLEVRLCCWSRAAWLPAPQKDRRGRLERDQRP